MLILLPAAAVAWMPSLPNAGSFAQLQLTSTGGHAGDISNASVWKLCGALVPQKTMSGGLFRTWVERYHVSMTT